MNRDWILFDGEFQQQDKKLFGIEDFSSILFVEKIRAIRNFFPFWSEHLLLIDLKLRIFNQPVPEYLQNDGRELKRQMERFLVKNKLYKSAQLQVYFVLNESKLSYLISHEKIDSTNFTLNREGYILEVFDKIQKTVSPLSSISLGADPIWKIIQKHALPESVSTFLVCNTAGDILEVPAKNIYLLKGDRIVTPAASIGAYIDVSREIVIEVVQQLGYDFEEVNEFKRNELLEADELFLASATDGIEWVKGFGSRRYFNKSIRKISEKFNELLIE